jgi:hypothetical protein
MMGRLRCSECVDATYVYMYRIARAKHKFVVSGPHLYIYHYQTPSRPNEDSVRPGSICIYPAIIHDRGCELRPAYILI